MARLGLDDRPEVFEWWEGVNNQQGVVLTMPRRAKVVTLGAWIRGVNGYSAPDYRLILWRESSGAILGQSAKHSIGQAGVGTGNLTRVERDLVSPVELDEGVQVIVGWARSKSSALQSGFHDHGSPGAHRDKTVDDWPGGMSGADVHGNGAIGAWIERYDPVAGAWIQRGGAWTKADTVQTYRSGVWTDADAVQVQRSSAWTDAD